MKRTDELASLRAENAELRAENAELRALLAQVQAQLAAALARIAELEDQRRDPPAFVKPNRPAPPASKPPRKQRDAASNRARRREPPTRIVTHAYDRCPTCAYALSGTSVASTRQVIDLPPPAPVEVVDHQVLKRWCPCCQQYQTPSLTDAGVALGRGRIGVRLASLIAYLRTTLRLPLASIQQYLATIHTCTLSIGGIQQVLDAVATALTPTVATLKQAARASPVLHADETGWRQNGKNGYVWCFTTPGDAAVRYYEYDHSRAHAIVKRVLGGQFDGHLVSDFYAAYNDYPGRHQRCWVHLLRDLHDLRTAQATDATVVTWSTDVEQVYRDAQAWTSAHPTAPAHEREAPYVALTSRLHTLGLQYAREQGHACCALAKRLLRHEDELFQCVLVAGLDADNNRAERAIRPVVMVRKLSGGSRSASGTRTRMTLLSAFLTWQVQKANPFTTCLAVLSQSRA